MPGLTSDSGEFNSLAIVPHSLETQSPRVYPLRTQRVTGPFARLSISWARGNTLRVSLLQSEKSSSELNTGGEVVEVKLSNVDGGEISDAQWRKIAYGSVTPFALLQSRKISVNAMLYDKDRWEHVMEYSKEINRLLSDSNSSVTPAIEDPKTVLKKVAEPTSLKAAWELIELFYADKQYQAWIPERLLDWLADFDCLLSATQPVEREREEKRGGAAGSMEGASSSGGNHQPRLPPGFRFHPTDEELLVHYLKKKAASAPLPVAIIAEIDLYKYDPWELPSKANFGEEEWYFFSPRERKYPNGERPNRAATSGYWKATGTDKPILTANGTQKIGVKKALVFYGGKPPKGIKTNWIMHEYRLISNNPTTNKPPGINLTKKSSSRLDDWVLCRIFKKNSSSSSMESSSSMDGYHSSIPGPGKPCDDRNYFPGNGSGLNLDYPVSISPLASSSLTGMMYSSKEWEGNGDHNFNPSSTSSHDHHKNNISFISLLNQQYSQTFNQDSLVNSQVIDGILHQSYQLPNSQFQ